MISIGTIFFRSLFSSLLLMLFAQCSQPTQIKQKTAHELSTVSKDSIPDGATAYRNENWHPEKGQYYFSEAYYFDYYNELVGDEELKASGTFGFYADPQTGTLLLEKHISNFSDEMTNYIIIKPDSSYILCFTDEFGDKKLVTSRLLDAQDIMRGLIDVQEYFKTYLTPQQQVKSFGATAFNPNGLKGQRYLQTFIKTMDTVEVYLADCTMPTTALYMVEEVFNELGLPVKMGYGYMLPDNKLVVSENYRSVSSKNVGFKLNAVEATEYHIQLPKN